MWLKDKNTIWSVKGADTFFNVLEKTKHSAIDKHLCDVHNQTDKDLRDQFTILNWGRLSYYPGLVGILPILLENSKSRLTCDRDRKNPDFETCFDISNKFLW